MKRQDSVYIVLLLVVLFFMGLPLSTDANCNTPIGAPHQSVAKNPSPDNFIYGISANISYGTPVLGCQNKLDSFTDEWVMVVGQAQRNGFNLAGKGRQLIPTSIFGTNIIRVRHRSMLISSTNR